MSGNNSPQWQCPRCGFTASNDGYPPALVYKPWQVRSRDAVKAYVESLGQETREWLLALFVDEDLNLLSVETIAQGDVSSVDIRSGYIFARGLALHAAGFILVHNHPSGDPRPSGSDRRVT